MYTKTLFPFLKNVCRYNMQKHILFIIRPTARVNLKNVSKHIICASLCIGQARVYVSIQCVCECVCVSVGKRKYMGVCVSGKEGVCVHV